MDTYAHSYPDSPQSSPPSHSLDSSSPSKWEDHQQPTATISPSLKVKLMCSYNGKIQPRPHDNQLAYIGGETKILVVDRGIKFVGLIQRLGALVEREVCFKYQLTGEDLDTLISVTSDDDLDHMMHEYDRLCRLSSKPARLRLFLFPTQTPTTTPSTSFGSSERERLVDALNSIPPQVTQPPPPLAVEAPPPQNVDFLFGTEHVIANNHVQQVAPTTHEDPIQRHIHDLKRLQIGEGMHTRISNDNLSGTGGFSGEYYTQKVAENLLADKVSGGVPTNLSAPGGMYHATAPVLEQTMYMMPTQAGMYQVPMGRSPLAGLPNQGYYTVQQMPPEFYRDQQQPYGMVTQVGTQGMAPPVYSEQQFGMTRSNAGHGVGMVDTTYAVGYNNGTGRPVYYNTPGGVVTTQYPAGVDMRAVGLTQIIKREENKL